MKIIWTKEALDFLISLETYTPNLNIKLFNEIENKLHKYAGLHVKVTIKDSKSRDVSVYKMFLSKNLPYKVYYIIDCKTIIVITIRHAKQKPLEG